VRTIKTYDLFERNIRSWVKNYIFMMLVTGPPGVGKTRIYQQIISEVQEENRKKSGCAVPLYHQLTGRMSAFECFRELRDDPRSLIIFDDLSGILGDRHFVSLLQQLCETRSIRDVRWNTGTHMLKDEEKFFSCTSRVLVVLNELPRHNDGVLAVLDRLDGINFVPSKREIITRMRRIWPDHGKLVDLMANLSAMPSLRTMTKLIDWERSPYLDAGEALMAECGVLEPIQHLVRIMTNEPKAQWFARYHQATGKGDRSYRRHKQIAEELVAALTGDGLLIEGGPTPSEEPPAEDDDVTRRPNPAT